MLFALSPAPALADELAPGLTYEVSNGYHVVIADLARIEVRANHPKAGAGQDFETVEKHAIDEGAFVAVNANYFDASKGGACGVARGFAEDFTRVYEEQTCSTTLGWSSAAAEIFSGYGHEADSAFRTDMTDMVTGGGVLLKTGPQPNWYEVSMPTGRAMTAVGLTADRSQFVFLATDKGTSSVSRMKATFTSYGVIDAIFLDGGGSTRLWIQGRSYVNLPEGADRNVPVVVMAIVPRAPDGGLEAHDAGEPDGGQEAQDAASTADAAEPAADGGTAPDAAGPEGDGGAADATAQGTDAGAADAAEGAGAVSGGCTCQGAGDAGAQVLPQLVGMLVLAPVFQRRKKRQ